MLLKVCCGEYCIMIYNVVIVSVYIVILLYLFASVNLMYSILPSNLSFENGIDFPSDGAVLWYYWA